MPMQSSPMPRSTQGKNAYLPGDARASLHGANPRAPPPMQSPNQPRTPLGHGVSTPQHHPASNAMYPQSQGHGDPSVMSTPQRPMINTQSPQPQFTTLGQQPIMSSQRAPPPTHHSAESHPSAYQAHPTSQLGNQQNFSTASLHQENVPNQQQHLLPPQRFQQLPAQTGPVPPQTNSVSPPGPHQLPSSPQHYQKPTPGPNEVLHGQAIQPQSYQQFNQPAVLQAAHQVTQPPTQQPQGYLRFTQPHGQHSVADQQPPQNYPQSTPAPRQPPVTNFQAPQAPGQPTVQRFQPPQNYPQSTQAPGQPPNQGFQTSQNYPQSTQVPGQPLNQRPQTPQNYPQSTQVPEQPRNQRPQTRPNYPQSTQVPGQPPDQGPQAPQNYPQSAQAAGQPLNQRPQAPQNYPQSTQVPGRPFQNPQGPRSVSQPTQVPVQPPIQRPQVSQNFSYSSQTPGQPLNQRPQVTSNFPPQTQSSQPSLTVQALQPPQHVAQPHDYSQSMATTGQSPVLPTGQHQTPRPPGQMATSQAVPPSNAPRMQQSQVMTQPQNYPASQGYQRPPASNYSSNQPSPLVQNRPPAQHHPQQPTQQFVQRYPQGSQSIAQPVQGVVSQSHQLNNQQYQKQSHQTPQSIPRNHLPQQPPLQNSIHVPNQSGPHQNMPMPQNSQQQTNRPGLQQPNALMGQQQGPAPQNLSGVPRQQMPVPHVQNLPPNQTNPAGGAPNQVRYHQQQQFTRPPMSQNPQVPVPTGQAPPQHELPARYPAPNLPAQQPAQPQPAPAGNTSSVQPQQSNSTGAQVQNSANMPEPLMPTVVGAKLSVPLESSRPSADLEGLTYIPSSEILLPKITNTSADELLTASPESESTVVPQSKSVSQLNN